MISTLYLLGLSSSFDSEVYPTHSRLLRSAMSKGFTLWEPESPLTKQLSMAWPSFKWQRGDSGSHKVNPLLIAHLRRHEWVGYNSESNDDDTN